MGRTKEALVFCLLVMAASAVAFATYYVIVAALFILFAFSEIVGGLAAIAAFVISLGMGALYTAMTIKGQFPDLGGDDF